MATFLSLFQGQPFEVQVPQSFNDGNIDFECVLTAQAEGLWLPRPGVDGDDIRHAKSTLAVPLCGRNTRPKKKGYRVDGVCAAGSGMALRPSTLLKFSGPLLRRPQQETTLAGMDDLVEKRPTSPVQRPMRWKQR